MNKRLVILSLATAGLLTQLPSICRIIGAIKDELSTSSFEHELHMKAIAMTRDELVARASQGEFYGESGEQLDRRFEELLEFNKIAIREDN